MAKQKKNANYQTEKTIAEKARKEEAKQKEEQTEKIKFIAIVSSICVAVVALIIGFLIAVGVFNYHPEVTSHALLTIDDYGTFHIELYGNDAPDATAKFVELGNKNHFNGKTIHTFKDGLLYGGDEKVTNATETNPNKVALEKGIICVSTGKSTTNSSCQFIIVTEDNTTLPENFIAIGKIDDLGILNKIIDGIETDESGKITAETAPKITSVSDHAEHH